MTNELVPAQPQAVAVRPEPIGLGAILAAAQDGSVDVAKVEQLIALYERMQDRQAEAAFNRAMVACQAEMPRVTANKILTIRNKTTGEVRPQSRYATLERLDEFVRDIYQRHGFSISYNMEPQETSKQIYVAIVKHIGGHSETYRQPLALDTSGNKNEVQAGGSTKSYARRYFLLDIWNIIVEGQDLNGAPPQSDEPITREQVSQLLDWINATGASEARLVEWANKRAHGVTKLEEIPAGMWPEIKAQYERKAKGAAK